MCFLKRILLVLALLVSSAHLYAGENVHGVLKGSVTDLKQEPLSGVDVIVNNNQVVVTDGKGNFSIDLKPGSYVITFSHIQYQTVHKKINVTANQPVMVAVKLLKENYSLKDITVTGSAMPTEVGKIASSVSIIKSTDPVMDQIETPDDALNFTPGVYVRRLKGLSTSSGHTQIMMRGTGAANRTLVMKDGIPLNDAYTGGVLEWNTTATNSISRIEVVRGPGSALYGSGSMGGTINIITQDPQAKPTIGVNVRQGSLNTTIVGAKVGKLFKSGFGIIGFVEYKHTDGYQYMADSLWNDYYRKPENKLFNGLIKASYQTGEHSKLQAIFDYHQQKGYNGTSTSYLNNYKMMNSKIRFSGGTDATVNYDLNLYYDFQHRNADAEKWNSTDEQFNTAYYTTKTPVNTYGFIGKVNKKLAFNSFTIGADIKRSDLEYTKNKFSSGTLNFSGNQNFTSFFFNDDISLWDVLNANIGVRFDHWKNTNGKVDNVDGDGDQTAFSYEEKSSNLFSPKVGLSYHATDFLRFRASYAMGFKAPSMYYMYNSYALGSYFRLGNPDLKPERMTYSVDFGFDLNLSDKLSLSGTYYMSSYKDFMDNVILDDSEVPDYVDAGDLPVKQYINIGKVNLSGVEASLNYEFLPHLKAIVSYFYNHSEIKEYDTDTEYVGNHLDNSPKQLLNGGLVYANSKILNASVWIHHTGDYYSDLENSEDVMVDPSNVFDVKVSRKVGHFTISANVLNVFDETYYGSFTSAKSYYYAAPRTVNVGLSYQF